jgi:hypothetical protein
MLGFQPDSAGKLPACREQRSRHAGSMSAETGKMPVFQNFCGCRCHRIPLPAIPSGVEESLDISEIVTDVSTSLDMTKLIAFR